MNNSAPITFLQVHAVSGPLTVEMIGIDQDSSAVVAERKGQYIDRPGIQM